MDEESEEILNRMSTLISGSGVSLVGMITKQTVETITTLVLTTLIGGAGYGIIASVRRVTQFLNSSSAGIQSSLTRTVPRHDEPIQNLIITVSYILITLVSIILGVGLFTFKSEILSYTVIRPQDIVAVGYSSVMLFGLMQISMTVAVFRSFKQIKNLSILQLVSLPLIILLLVLLTLFSLERTVSNVVGAIAVAHLIVASIGILAMYRITSYDITNIQFDKEALKDYFVFLIPTSVSTLIVIIQLFSFSIFMAVLLEPVEAGVFGVSLILSQFVRWPLQAVNHIFPPIATELYDDNEEKVLGQLYKRTSRLILTASLPPLAGFIVFYEGIATVFSAEYTAFAIVIPVMAFGQLIAAAHGSVGLLLIMTDNERRVLVLQTIITPFILGTTYVLTVNYGVLGLASAHLMAFILNNFLELVLLNYSEQFYPFTRSHLKPIGLIIIVTLLSAGVFTVSNVYISAGLFIVLSIAYYVVSFSYVLDDLDREILSKYKP